MGQGVREDLEAVHSEETHTQAAAARPQAPGDQPAALLRTRPQAGSPLSSPWKTPRAAAELGLLPSLGWSSALRAARGFAP